MQEAGRVAYHGAMETLPGEQGYEQETDLKTIPVDVLDWYALCETMQRRGVSLTEISQNDVAPEDYDKAESYLKEVITHQDPAAREHFFENIRAGKEMMDRSLEKIREHKRAFDELVQVIGTSKGDQLEADFQEVNEWLRQKSRDEQVYEPFTIISETARIAVERQIKRGVNGREMQALTAYLKRYSDITHGSQEDVATHMAGQRERDEAHMERIRATLN